jgi:hypothetical protein
MANLLAEAHAQLLIERDLFALREITEVESPYVSIGRDSWLRILDAGNLCLASPGEDHYPDVRLEKWDSTPPPHEGPWEETGELKVLIPEGLLSVWTLTMGPAGAELAVEVGWNHLRIHTAGGQAIHALETGPYHPHEDFPRGIESWLIQIWPA